jgi:glycosyltransferase involved in cell wall biosynthesis
MNITVILCTYNRCLSLAKALASIAASTLPESVRWEVLVVDNNSTDQTRIVVEEFRQQFPGRFRYLFEPRPGKSFALNSGTRDSQADILVFTDDDVVVEPTWLRNLTAPLGDTQWTGIGGRTLLERTFTQPPWLALQGPYNLGSLLGAEFDLGEKQQALHSAPYGANMAFRRYVFEKYGGFRTDLGPRPDSMIRNEDTDYGCRLLDAGEKLLYEPSAVVYHSVSESRMRKEYFLNWSFDFGRACVRMWPQGPDIFGIPRRFFTLSKMAALTLPLRGLRWMLDWSPPRSFFLKCGVWTTLGHIAELYSQLRDGSDGTEDPPRKETFSKKAQWVR